MTFLDCVCGGCIPLAATHCDPNNLSMLLANPCKTVRIRHRPSSSVPPPWQLKAHHTRPARKEMNIQILRVNICRWALFNALILKAAVTLQRANDYTATHHQTLITGRLQTKKARIFHYFLHKCVALSHRQHPHKIAGVVEEPSENMVRSRAAINQLRCVPCIK